MHRAQCTRTCATLGIEAGSNGPLSASLQYEAMRSNGAASPTLISHAARPYTLGPSRRNSGLAAARPRICADGGEGGGGGGN
jgi:hypothetical protein